MDVAAIVEAVRRRTQWRTAARPRTPPFDPHLSSELESLRHSTDLFHLPLVSSRGFRPSVMAFIRKGLRRLLLPWISRQTAYNAANVRMADGLRDQAELLAYHQALSTEDLLDTQSRLLDALCARLDAAVPPSLGDDIASIKLDITTLRENLAALRSDVSLLKAELTGAASELSGLKEFLSHPPGR